ncbi:MAG: hypothetical protein A4E42_02192 [Methanoregulaceae archaeon PtaU1.Bin222]|nr:MAG: hypothetical protein A4E42_02192 [Methanoregulaceae archaeon PtaU1.Bin222]
MISHRSGLNVGIVIPLCFRETNTFSPTCTRIYIPPNAAIKEKNVNTGNPKINIRKSARLTPRKTRLGPGKIPAVIFLDEKGYSRGIPGNARTSRSMWLKPPAHEKRNTVRRGKRSKTCPARLCHERKPATIPADTARMPGMLWVNPPWLNTKSPGSWSEILLNMKSISGSVAPRIAQKTGWPGNGLYKSMAAKSA